LVGKPPSQKEFEVERNLGTLVAILATGLLVAVALAFVVRGVSTPEVAEPEPVTTHTKVSAPRDGTPLAKPVPRPVPSNPAVVPADRFTTTASGLQFADLVEGTGEPPIPNGIVVVEFTGFLPDGKVFDSSYMRPEAFLFPLGIQAVFPGWEEGLMTMKVGGKRQLKVPSTLAYGDKGRLPKIPPGTDLLMDIELIEVKPPRVAPTAPQVIDPAVYQITETGLKFADLVVGTGASPTTGQLVQVDYTGWLENGTKFDSSLDRAKPIHFRFAMGKVIKGWDEGLNDMKIGGKRQLILPHHLAYGEEGRPPVIPPEATLTFEIELVSAKDL
jgi:peptidylprolyl isomerase